MFTVFYHMRINKLTLTNFRNYQEQKIEVASGTNVFIGKNAQGKTNILEAIYLCTCARSHRTGKDIELIKDGKDFYQIDLEFESDQKLQQSIKIQYSVKPRMQREIYYCGLKQDKISDFFGLFHAVIFAPEDLMLIKEGPAIRRRFLDVLISQIKPRYFKNLQVYQHALKQRNVLLKTLKEMEIERKTNPQNFKEEMYSFNDIQLDIWTEKISEVQAQIIKTREEYIQKLEELAKKALFKISDGKEIFEIKYKTVSSINTQEDESDIYQSLLSRYKKQKHDDIFRGNTTSGIHRDDLELFVNENLLKERGSQGQQRSAVLALKLAELEILEMETGEKPVLLLDDVMSELDEKRREHLLQAFEENQVFITCTELSQIYPSLNNELKEAEETNSTDNNLTPRDAYDEAEDHSYIHFFEVNQGTVKRQILV